MFCYAFLYSSASVFTQNQVDSLKATDIVHSNRSWLVMALQEEEEYGQLAYLYHHSEQFPWSPAAAC